MACDFASLVPPPDAAGWAAEDLSPRRLRSRAALADVAAAIAELRRGGTFRAFEAFQDDSPVLEIETLSSRSPAAPSEKEESDERDDERERESESDDESDDESENESEAAPSEAYVHHGTSRALRAVEVDGDVMDADAPTLLRLLQRRPVVG